MPGLNVPIPFSRLNHACVCTLIPKTETTRSVKGKLTTRCKAYYISRLVNSCAWVSASRLQYRTQTNAPLFSFQWKTSSVDGAKGNAWRQMCARSRQISHSEHKAIDGISRSALVVTFFGEIKPRRDSPLGFRPRCRYHHY